MKDYILTQDWRGHRAGGQLQLSDRDAEKLTAAGIVQPIPAVAPPEPEQTTAPPAPETLEQSEPKPEPEPTTPPEAEAVSDKPKKTKGGAK